MTITKQTQVHSSSAHPPRTSAQWGELNSELFTTRGQRPQPDKGVAGSGLQAEVFELGSIDPSQRSLAQHTRLRRLEYELEKVTSQLVELNFGLVRDHVKRFSIRASRDAIEEFEGAGTLGLMKAINSYDPSRGSFSGWASRFILSEVLRTVRDEDFANLNRTDFESRPNVLGALRELQNGDDSARPKFKDIAAKAGVSVGQVERILNAPRLDSLFSPVGDGDMTLGDSIERKDNTVNDLGVVFWADANCANSYDERSFRIVSERIGLGYPAGDLSSIGAKLRLSTETTVLIKDKIRAKLTHPVIMRKSLEGRQASAL